MTWNDAYWEEIAYEESLQAQEDQRREDLAWEAFVREVLDHEPPPFTWTLVEEV